MGPGKHPTAGRVSTRNCHSAAAYFDQDTADETEVRRLADALFSPL